MRRWPAAFAVGGAVAWGLHGLLGGRVSDRAAAPLLALVLALWPRPGWGPRLGAAALLVALTAWGAPHKAAEVALVMGVAATVPGALLAGAKGPALWPVVAVAGLCAAVLLAFTGSVTLAEEAALVALPALALVGRPLPPGAGAAAGLALGAAVGHGLLWSELGPWALVPLASLAAVRLPTARAAPRIGLALALAAAGTVPVIVDWLQDPPF